jgi:hypothetical protein
MGNALCSCRSSPFLFAPVLFRLSFHGRCIRVLTGLLWLPKDTCHVAAGWALIRDQSWLTSDRRNPHHRVHCGFASRACHGAGFRKVRHATHTPCDRVSKPHSCKGNSLASGAFSHRKKGFSPAGVLGCSALEPGVGGDPLRSRLSQRARVHANQTILER